MKLCHINFHPLIISPKWFSKQNVILLSSMRIYNCPVVEAYRNSVCLHVTGLPLQDAFFLLMEIDGVMITELNIETKSSTGHLL